MLGRFEEALVAIDRVVTLDQNSVGIWVMCKKGVTLSDLGRHGEALEAYERALALDPDTNAYRMGQQSIRTQLA